jgi:uncharacterized protein (TIGR02145 family)
LVTAVGGLSKAGAKLKSRSGWSSDGSNGTDDFGFSALPAGGRYDGGDYGNVYYKTYFWSSTEANSFSAYCMFLNYDSIWGEANLINYDKSYAFSVRCLKD